MKRLITSASLAALGAVSLQAAYAPGLSETERAKPWSVSATLRGFYDDNYTDLPSKRVTPGPVKRDTFGFDISPRGALNYPLGDSTLASLEYIYGLRYYEDRKNNSADHSHQVNAKIDHAMSENYKIDVSDSFVIAQEPELLDPSSAIGMKLRTDGNNLRNTGAVKFHGQFTPKLGAVVGYSNSLWDYEQKGMNSYSALLDRMEHNVNLDFRFTVRPTTVGVVGYNLGIKDHADDYMITLGGVAVPARIRDSMAHSFYIGADQNFTPQLNGSVRLGAQYIDYSELSKFSAVLPAGLDESTIIPYADANLTYAFTTASSVLVGIKHSKVQTDITALDQEATTLYGSLTYAITAKLSASLLGQVQNGTFYQGFKGGVDDQAEQFYMAGLNIAYQINKFLAAETGYNFDRLDSDVLDRSFSRNRVYLGVRASY